MRCAATVAKTLLVDETAWLNSALKAPGYYRVSAYRYPLQQLNHPQPRPSVDRSRDRSSSDFVCGLAFFERFFFHAVISSMYPLAEVMQVPPAASAALLVSHPSPRCIRCTLSATQQCHLEGTPCSPAAAWLQLLMMMMWPRRHPVEPHAASPLGAPKHNPPFGVLNNTLWSRGDLRTMGWRQGACALLSVSV